MMIEDIDYIQNDNIFEVMLVMSSIQQCECIQNYMNVIL